MTEQDRRGTIKIKPSLFNDFLINNYNVYARDIVWIGGLEYPLVISVSLKQNIIVSLGSDILYSGDNIAEAIRIYNLDIEGLKKLWVNVLPNKRNMVNHPKQMISKD